jgi:hypothetical protein
MEQHVRRYFFGVVGFAFVVTWATLGATDAIVAVIMCVAGMNVDHLSHLMNGTQTRTGRRPPRSTLAARPLDAEHAYQLVPDEPSLILSTQPSNTVHRSRMSG